MAGPQLLSLRESFLRAGFTVEGVLARLGEVASAALLRGEIVPALRATGGGDDLDVLIRLFLLHRPVPQPAAAHAIPWELATTAGLVAAADAGHARALLEVRPYTADDAPPEGWWVVSDRARELADDLSPLRADHVLGVGGASATLAQLAVRTPAASALDVGTGCGVQALHLARHSERVVATDVLPRALALARMTAALSNVQLELREGSLLDPVAGERFDRIVSNPPFVVHPDPAGAHFTYRDSGLRGDDLGRRLVGALPDRLADGGWAHLLANWVHRRGTDWREHVQGWLDPHGSCDVWVVQRDVQAAADYVAMWLRDSGETAAPDYLARYDAWLDAFEREGVEAIGFGYISLHRAGAERPVVRLEEWPHPVEQPLGPHVERWGEVAVRLRDVDDAGLLRARLLVAPDVRQEQLGLPGAEDPEVIVLRQHVGMRRAHTVSTELAALAGACTGDLPLGALVAAVARVLDLDETAAAAQLLPEVRLLLADGLLVCLD